MWQQQVERGGIYSLAFSPDSKTIYTGDGTGWVTAWDRTTGESQRLFQLKAPRRSEISRLAVSRNNQLMLAGGRTTFGMWDLKAAELLPSLFSGRFFDDSFALSADGNTLATVGFDQAVTFWHLSNKTVHPSRPPVRFRQHPVDLAFSPRDATLAIVGMDGGLYLIGPASTKAERINTTAADQIVEVFDESFFLAFSPNGSTLAVACGGFIRLWDMATRTVRLSIPAGRKVVRRMAYHPRGTLLASIGDMSEVTFWDTTTGQFHNRYDWAIGKKLRSVAFSPDGMTAAVGSASKTFVVWDLDGS